MSDLGTLYERNAAFAAAFDKGELAITPNLTTVILTCMDARVDPAHIAGIELGDAFVMRTAGGRVTDSVATEISMLWELMTIVTGAEPSLELAIIEHTNCGMARFADPEISATIAERFGKVPVVATYAIGDMAGALGEDLARLRANDLVPRALRVSGHIYDITNGRLSQVFASAPLG